MPPLLLFAAVGAGCYAGYRVAARFIEALRAEEHQGDMASRADGAGVRASARNLGDLEWDAKTGVYRPKRGH